MFTPDPAKIMAFETAKKLNNWLQANHEHETELWVKIYKKKSGITSLVWTEVVIECLCWGWIDGIKKSLDEQAYLQRITPRKARSNWSQINTEHVERLIKSGQMQESGMVHVNAAKADGRWDNAYAPASRMKVPADFISALEGKPKVKAFYQSLPKSSLHAIAYGLDGAKKPETRARRFSKFMDMLEQEEKPGFGFKKN